MAKRGQAADADAAQMKPEWRAIVFDPLSYISPQRLALPPGLANPQSRAIVNDMLIDAYSLDTRLSGSEISNPAQKFLRHWPRLPQAAYLMGCQTLRAELLRQGAILRLPVWAQAFARLPLGTAPGRASGSRVSHRDLTCAGYLHLLRWRDWLPPALAQRLPLLFPPMVDRLAATGQADAQLLTLALQQAGRHPFAPPSNPD
ncbi:type III secretion apparatus protein OrgA/MxiK [Chromobacterium sp. IIBBL 290-4]|uniref:type III secretion apparatus protein OrgA/MxiK n=1 Tax=Chromobacterium sp. IIBBL 290-4 TaxID=2953890 RepID=UPI0020B84A0D|nr:type III secretion apparatus protein OrgA/MxiK [Chromobacterium sp. IIBBL 290-4]UTH74118.1 type III secretion apparatus protein OrgA/MxiK [Chromobacterium sp. IIBBL 290-4]